MKSNLSFLEVLAIILVGFLVGFILAANSLPAVTFAKNKCFQLEISKDKCNQIFEVKND